MTIITFILDTSAILAIQQVLSVLDMDTSLPKDNNTDIQFLTTREIVDEFIDDFSKFRIRSMIFSGELKTALPTPEALSFIQQKSFTIGNQTRLSSQDKTILALAWQKKEQNKVKQVILLTDDFEIQNTAYLLGIDYRPIRTKGISYSVMFRKYCADCRSKLGHDMKTCDNCGSMNIKLRKMKKKIKKRMNS